RSRAMSSSHRLALRVPLAALLAGLCVWSVAGESGARPESSASLVQYQIPGGAGVFALSLKAGALAEPASHDVVILVDTSASQTGAHREQALAALEGLLQGLRPADTVRLFAVDTQTRALMDSFAAPQSAPVQTALKKLHDRVPLGATDLGAALETARSAF